MADQRVKDQEDILVVDDTRANLRLLSQMLNSRGYHVRAVTSGSRALESARATAPNLILLDIRMPEMDGYQVCEQLKTDQRTREIPVIFISALDDIQDKVKAFQAGGVDYITKPFHIEEVIARTETHLALRHLQKKLLDANEKFERELLLAGKMQSSLMPSKPPPIPGWEFSVKLMPARETSGDFFDIFHLPDGNFGVLIADVVDKGVGAALFMVLCWSLIRTYAADHPEDPKSVFQAVNQRILTDTQADQFVTVFYGVIDPNNGYMVYCNAGHNPPLLLSKHGNNHQKQLTRTGVPLGIFEETKWEQRIAQIDHNDVLVLYTDGITEAQNKKGESFGEQRLFDALGSSTYQSVTAIENQILTNVYEFVDHAMQNDDIALVILGRGQK
jgi:sigma-B regulation protein RsbU (phosphoserine phosphatase)